MQTKHRDSLSGHLMLGPLHGPRFHVRPGRATTEFSGILLVRLLVGPHRQYTPWGHQEARHLSDVLDLTSVSAVLGELDCV